ncbi:allantoicase [Ascoidea rubescens DSM 1968]|uniref:Allantoicase n=1 Tax=Ascoidea rubescens DSM 1968 TaxID=1344418 RepID=A0A1D2VPQ5_9ASCO|nr:Allantoicase [Ascoidea rubescens DSM 1968]ODV63564.1 Allantoicase [Ascoidea rubescens DSM 1968]
MSVIAKEVSVDEFQENIIPKYTDVINEKLGGKILKFSDEWFASADNLIKPYSPVRKVNKFTHAGAWFDGWETRRHNPEPYDYVIVKIAVSSANIIAAEIDTAFFDGNQAPAISIDAANLSAENKQRINWNDENLDIDKQIQWEEILPVLKCGPSRRQFFIRDSLTKNNYTHVRLKMYPDGGIARFRLYGLPIPIFPTDLNEIFDSASILLGAIPISYSDKHFGEPNNLLLPGRGVDMGDGWETKRSRSPNHNDWVIIKLSNYTKIDSIIIDTAHFRGNYPQSIQVKAINYPSDKIEKDLHIDDPNWKTVVPISKTGPDKEHYYSKKDNLLQNVYNNETYNYVSLTIYPDGGVKRLRVLGARSIE